MFTRRRRQSRWQRRAHLESESDTDDDDNDTSPPPASSPRGYDSDDSSDDEQRSTKNNSQTLKKVIEQQRLEIKRLREELSRRRSQADLVYEIPMILDPIGSKHTITSSELLFCGLAYAGFDQKRQENVKEATNVRRFVAFYGVPHTALTPLFIDVKDRYPNTIMKDLLMTVNWLKGYDTHEVLAGRWGYCEEYIAPRVKEYARKIQSFAKDKIRLPLDSRRKLVASLDTVTFLCTEMRLDPSSKWYDPKVSLFVTCGLYP
jgi:hypothetical protein